MTDWLAALAYTGFAWALVAALSAWWGE